MELLFVKGDKGLVANRNGKFYFPDRRSNIKEEGLYSCTVTIEKDNYAFVDGQKIETVMPSETFMQKYIERMQFEENPVLQIDSFAVRKIGESILVFKSCNDIVTVGYMCATTFDVYDGYVELFRFDETNRHDYKMNKLYSERRFELVPEFVTFKNSFINSSIEEILTDKNRMNILTQMFCHILCYELHNSENVKSIKIHDNKFVEILTKWQGVMGVSVYDTKIYAYNKLFGIMNWPSDNLPNYNTANDVEVDVEDVVNWMIENHVGVGYWSNQRLCTKSVSFMGEYVDVTYINGTKDFAEVSEEEKEMVAKSFENFETFRKRVGKYITKTNMHEFHKLSPKVILGL